MLSCYRRLHHWLILFKHLSRSLYIAKFLISSKHCSHDKKAGLMSLLPRDRRFRSLLLIMNEDDFFFSPTSLLVLVAVGVCLLHTTESHPNIRFKLKQEATEDCISNLP